MRLLVALCLAAAAAVSVQALPVQAQTKLTLTASDGVAVSALQYSAKGGARATVLLFHMAGSNKAEYAPIAPRLAALEIGRAHV